MLVSILPLSPLSLDTTRFPTSASEPSFSLPQTDEEASNEAVPELLLITVPPRRPTRRHEF